VSGALAVDEPGGVLGGVLWGLKRDLKLAARSSAEVMIVLGFFFVVVALFPLGVGPEPALLARIAAGVVWVCALLACLLSLHRLFAADFADGSLEQMLFGQAPFVAVVYGKIGAHWMTSGWPLMAATPLVGVQLGLDADAIGVLLLTLLPGTAILSLIGAVMGALTLGVRAGGALLALLVLPLYVPVLVFGVGAVESYSAGMGIEGHLSVLVAELLLAIVAAPFAAAAALKIAID
jgi:heme exporter protein B